MKKILYYSFIVAALTFGTQTVLAQNPTYTLLEPLPCIEGTGNNCAAGEMVEEITINQYIAYVFKFAIALAVLLATVMIIIGGFQWMFSETPYKIGDAKKRINNAVFGLIAALGSFLILQTIDPRLVQINTTLDPICPKGSEKDANSICKPIDLFGFSNAIQQEIAELNAADRARIDEILSAERASQDSIRALEEYAAANNGELPPDLQNNLESHKMDVARREAERLETIARLRGSRKFATALEVLRSPQNYYIPPRISDFLFTPGRLTSDAETKIESSLISIRSMQDIETTLRSKQQPGHAARVAYRRQFYTEQIGKEKVLGSLIMKYVQTSGAKRTEHGRALQLLKNEYSNPPARVIGEDAELKQEQITLYQTRVENINKALAAPLPQ